MQGYGGTISIPTPDAADIQSVSLVRLMSATHHYEANQRFVWLQIVSKTANSVTVSSPVNGNIAPPGYYMIHVLNGAGVPSEARIIQIDGTDAADTNAPGQVTGLSIIPASASQLDLVWTPNPESDVDHYDVHRDTVSGFTPSATNLVAQPAVASYSDTGLDSSTTYYYRVAAVDTSNNIGPMVVRGKRHSCSRRRGVLQCCLPWQCRSRAFCRRLDTLRRGSKGGSIGHRRQDHQILESVP